MTEDNPEPPEPGEPLPVEGPTFTAPPNGSIPPPPWEAPHRAVRILVALVVVLFLVAGTFGTLWFVERGDHKTTAGQLDATRAEVDYSEGKQRKAEAEAKDAQARAMQAASERAKLEDARIQDKLCVDAGKALSLATEAQDSAWAKKATDDVVIFCHAYP
jgi:hypothetical protein